MNKNKQRVLFSIRFTVTIVATCLCALGTVFAADDAGDRGPSAFKGAIPQKSSKFPKVSNDLLRLQQDFQTYHALPQGAPKAGPFTPHVKLMRTSGDVLPG